MGTSKTAEQQSTAVEDANKLSPNEVEVIRERVYETFGILYRVGEVDTLSLVSARELSESNLIRWITSYKALLKYVSKDYEDIFKPKKTGTRSGTRYQVPVENIVTFLVLFEENKL